ncbi:(2Fe-2S)-binding protein [Eubacteriaceae bacterium ES3]|nr:(2Fe-2S)-binding protein [Eubacteriaceae bacterium ES3]
METIKMTVNGDAYELDIEKNWTLLHILREVIGLTGTKCGCSTGDCGACMVLFNGGAQKSCLIKGKKADGAQIMTIEGFSSGEVLHPIQMAFIEAGAVQCGYCTPGMIISAKALLDRNPIPTEEEIRKAIDGNLCRCTGYEKIVEAIMLASRLLQEED